MAFLEVRCFSEVLGLSVSFSVLLPQRTDRQVGLASSALRPPFPTLYLLHGLSDDHTIWMRRTSIERYAAERGIAVVMPAVARSFYQDMVSGPRYWSFISEELPALCRQWFPLSDKREDTFAAGLSMGGYGALRLALAQPERFAAAASLSGALDLSRFLREVGRPGSRIGSSEWQGIFGPDLSVEGTPADLFFLARQLAGSQLPRPSLYRCCGAEDELLRDTRAFHRHLDELQIQHTSAESPGAHDWSYWDAQIQCILDWLPVRKK